MIKLRQFKTERGLIYYSSDFKGSLGYPIVDVGYFLTGLKLEQFAKECFEAAKVVIVRRNSYGPIEYTSPDFATFWAERKEKVKDEKN